MTRHAAPATSPIRVVYCIEAMVHGGTEKQLAALIKGVDRRRVTPSLCVLKPSSMDLASLDCDVLELGFRSFRTPGALWCLGRMRRFILDQRADVIQTCFQDPTLLGWLASIQTPVRARIAAFRDLGFWRTRMKVAQLRLAYPAFDGFIANSAAVARHVHEADGIPLDRIEVIPNGVVMPAQAPAKGAGRPVVGIVANLDRPVKRVDLFLSAARIVSASIPDVEFAVIGDGHLRAGLTQQAKELGIGDRVRFRGSVADAGDDIRRFSVGVIASDSEGLSNAILEYMAAGVPAVARAVGGNGDAVVDGETGHLVQSSDAAALAAAIVGLLRDEPRRLRMGERAFSVARQRFSMDTCVRRHHDYYDRILSGAAAPSRLAVTLS